jgi:chromosome segregation ATPase
VIDLLLQTLPPSASDEVGWAHLVLVAVGGAGSLGVAARWVASRLDASHTRLKELEAQLDAERGRQAARIEALESALADARADAAANKRELDLLRDRVESDTVLIDALRRDYHSMARRCAKLERRLIIAGEEISDADDAPSTQRGAR